ncbi:hypothetical protein A21D_03803 [Virgibacillus dokdonensis]|uniref:Uncharacterized protein n=1 Tax=Virgibacillus dokdonensis TaxID=302167 RepID=A0A2K9J4I1_9BACI|nr:hypothetical protein A21D_03803 [Virgibacillus dokdonensis]
MLEKLNLTIQFSKVYFLISYNIKSASFYMHKKGDAYRIKLNHTQNIFLKHV